MNIKKNNKVAGRLLIASGCAFFVTAAMMRQPAFAGVGGALVVIGAAISRKKNAG